jgi:phenylalanyl-tRNA synthetase beta chain
MPKIDVSYSDLCKLMGRTIPADKLRGEDIFFAKSEVDDVVGDAMKIDVKDTNRPDLWSAEGVAREIRLRYRGDFPAYKTKKSKVTVVVDGNLKDIRPMTVCAVVRGLKINDDVLTQLIQLQEKVAGNFGRNRKEVAIGVYDLNKIKPPIRFTAIRPDGIKFTPLDFEKELTPREILEKHPKGKEFGHLLKEYSKYPIFIDFAEHVLSMPPIINSAHTGKVTNETTDVFIECSGFHPKFLNVALNVMVAALAERGGTIETVEVVYADKTMVTPDLAEKKFSIDLDYINKISGLALTVKDATKLLERSGYKVAAKGGKLDLLYPAYRQDIMHARDIVEDILITYGFNKIEPDSGKLPTTGQMLKKEALNERYAEIMVGAGFQEVLSYTLTNKADLFEKMDLQPVAIAEIDNPMSSNWSVFRNWLLPGMLDFLSRNKHVEYPQRIFEMGNCIVPDEEKETRVRDESKLAAAISNSLVSYEDVSAVLDAFMRALGVKYDLRKSTHGSFIDGRHAVIIVDGRNIGMVGEIHPKILNNWKLEKPVVAFEIDLQHLM